MNINRYRADKGSNKSSKRMGYATVSLATKALALIVMSSDRKNIDIVIVKLILNPIFLTKPPRP